MTTKDAVVSSTSNEGSTDNIIVMEERHKIRVAVTQAEPEWFDLAKGVKKTCCIIEEAAKNGAQLVSFPECWIVGYPAWIWTRPVDLDLHVRYMKNSLKRNSPEMDMIRACAAKHKITVVLGFSENDHDSLYISQSIIGSDGVEKMLRRKLKPTHMERTVFGDASGNCLKNVVSTDIGRVGALACWEHTQPLLKYHTMLQREHIHVAAWPPVYKHSRDEELWSMSAEGCRTLSRNYAIESQSFVLHTTSVISQAAIDMMSTSQGITLNTPGGGTSAIFGPDGRQLSKDLPSTEEGIIYADLDFNAILRAKSFLDPCGHYSRPDMLHLVVDDKEKKNLRAHVL